MYQIKISVDENNSDWISAAERLIRSRLTQTGGIMTVYAEHGRISLSAACENRFKSKLISVVREGLVEMFATVVKMQYIEKKLRVPVLDEKALHLLLHTLVAFDRECEHDLMREKLTLMPDMNLDGIYNFRFAELKKRWDEICMLTCENSVYLHNEENLNELLRFLISAINPKIMRLELSEAPEGYKLSGELEKGIFRLTALKSEQLLLYLIDLAPIELVIDTELSDKKLARRLRELFDARYKEDAVCLVQN